MSSLFILSSDKLYNENSAGAARMMNYAKALANEGVNVYFCSSALEYRFKDDKTIKIKENIYYLGVERTKKRNKILNKLFSIYYTILYLNKVNKKIKSLKSHVVIYIYPSLDQYFIFLTLILYKFCFKYKVYIEINELRSVTLIHWTYSQNKLKKIYESYNLFFKKIHFKILEKLTKYYDGLIVISTNLEKYFSDHNSNIIRIPILADIEQGYHFPDKYDYHSEFKISFFGMIAYQKEGFLLLYQALKELKKTYPNFVLNLYGSIKPNEKELILNSLPQELGIKDNIQYFKPITHNQVLIEMQKNHLLILPRPKTLQNHYGFSTKLSEYMASGIPFLVTDVSDNNFYIRDNYNGFIIPPDDKNALLQKLIFIISNYNSFKDEVTKNAFETAKEFFHYNLYSLKIKEFLKL